MLDQGFTSGSFRRLLRPIDFSNKRHSLPSDKKKLEKKLAKIEKKYQSGKADVSLLEEFDIDGKSVYKAKNFSTDILLRKLSDNIRRLYGIRQPDRTEIVKQVIELVRDGTPIQIIRRDVKSFYESIPRDIVLNKINNDYLLSWESKKLLNKLFDSKIMESIEGVPRGLGISAVLSELYMRPLDKFVRNIEGVIYYARYVDDIVIISFKGASEIEEAVKNKLESIKLYLNEEKSPPAIILPEKGKNLCECDEACSCEIGLDYLGYKIAFPVGPQGWDRKRAGRYVSVSLSDKKIKRLKARVVKSFLDYTRNNNFSLLENRVSYLTSNYPLTLNRFKKNLKGGIYYHYPLINNMEILSLMDIFLKKLVFSKRGSLGKKISVSLEPWQKQILKRYSFESGFREKYFVNLSQKDIYKTNECWRYV